VLSEDPAGSQELGTPMRICIAGDVIGKGVGVELLLIELGIRYEVRGVGEERFFCIIEVRDWGL
jgi:hypothetical protein